MLPAKVVCGLTDAADSAPTLARVSASRVRKDLDKVFLQEVQLNVRRLAPYDNAEMGTLNPHECGIGICAQVLGTQIATV